MRIVTWNLERKRPSSPLGAAAVERIQRERPDLVVVTEARIGHLDALGGHQVMAGPTPNWKASEDERKVVMWSAEPWTDVDDVGHAEMPGGRFVAATTETSLGPLRVWGVCIPYQMADVKYGSRDRKPWEQHLPLAGSRRSVAGRARRVTAVGGGRRLQPANAAWQEYAQAGE